MHILNLTVEHEVQYQDGDDWLPGVDYAVIKLSGYEVARVELDYYHSSESRDDLEQAAADWLRAKLA